MPHPSLLATRRALMALAPAAIATLASLRHSGAWAQAAAYPERLIRMVVPNAPGSSIDTIGRIAATHLAQALRQPVVADNRPGAAGALGVEAGRTSVPDGYTVILASSSSMTVAPLLQRAARYDPLRDFDLVSLIALLPNVLVCHMNLPVHNTAELVAYAKSRGNKTNMASAGIGSVSHLAGVALQAAGGFESLHVPYKGGSQGVASVVSGETDWVLTPAPAAMALVGGGRLRLLGHSMSPESRPLGTTPAIGSTLAGFEFSSWIGLVAPKGLPSDVAGTLRQALQQSLQLQALRQSFEANGAVPAAGSAEEFRAYLARDIEQTRNAIRIAGVQPE
jgi:tripartite-type tricarboxylate transporter receptor subunit TctC